MTAPPDEEGRTHGGKLRWTLVTIFVVAVLFNYPWELAQAPLYVGMHSFSTTWWHCFVAGLGDGLLVLLIFAAGWAVLRRPGWFERPGVRGYIVMLTAGLAIGISVEWTAVHLAGRWTYTTQMPLMPGLNVGIAPVAQMLVLPPLIFRVVAALCGCAVANSTSRTGGPGESEVNSMNICRLAVRRRSTPR